MTALIAWAALLLVFVSWLWAVAVVVIRMRRSRTRSLYVLFLHRLAREAFDNRLGLGERQPFDGKIDIDRAFSEFIREARYPPFALSGWSIRDLIRFHRSVRFSYEPFLDPARLANAIEINEIPYDFPSREAILLGSVGLISAVMLFAVTTAPRDRWGSPSEFPVYNATVQPNGGTPETLLHGVRTQIAFHIGQPSLDPNAIQLPEISDRLKSLLAQSEDLDLFVTMTCQVCQNTEPQTLPVTFLRARRSSTVAMFNIIPDLPRLASGALPVITFSIDGNGIEIDFFKFSVRIRMPDDTPSSQKSIVSQCLPDVNDKNEPRSDLVIRLARANDRLGISFTAPNPELARRIEAAGAGKNAAPRVFQTGVQTLAMMPKASRETYLRLKALVERHPLLRAAFTDTGEIKPQSMYAFDPESKATAVSTLYGLGANLYDTLFVYDADPRLATIMNEIESFGDTHPNLRILIYSDQTYLPWQLLHRIERDGSTPDALQFWGFKYILGVIPTDPERDCGRLPGELRVTSGKAILYAHYWQGEGTAGTAADAPDTVSRMGAMFGKELSKALKSDAMMTSRSKVEFTNGLKGAHNDLRIIWTFTHGHSGSEIVQLGNNEGKEKEAQIRQPVFAFAGLEGQRLAFSKTDAISARDIKEITRPQTQPPFFSRRPLVFLNGCETGTEGTEGTTPESLPGVFIARGARGVIATEASVWEGFGYHFANSVLDKLSHGWMVGEAIQGARNEFLLKSGNPLGLLYSFYGNPATRVVY